MKSFNQFLSESVNIAGDFNGNLYLNSPETHQSVEESFTADVVWKGRLYRMVIEGRITTKNELTEQLQNEYPGAVVHNIYPHSQSSLNIKSAKRYQPERYSWTD